MIGIKTLLTKIMNILTAWGSVGSIYITTSDTNPQAIFGGTWEKITDRFLVGAGSGYGLNDIGGENTHTLTVAEMPTHSHSVVCSCDRASERSGKTHSYIWKNNSGGSRMAAYGDITGVTAGQPHENRPAFYGVYIWQRIS